MARKGNEMDVKTIVVLTLLSLALRRYIDKGQNKPSQDPGIR